MRGGPYWTPAKSGDWRTPVRRDGRVGFGVARGFAVVRDGRSAVDCNADGRTAHKFTKSRVLRQATCDWSARSCIPVPDKYRHQRAWRSGVRLDSRGHGAWWRGRENKKNFKNTV